MSYSPPSEEIPEFTTTTFTPPKFELPKQAPVAEAPAPAVGSSSSRFVDPDSTFDYNTPIIGQAVMYPGKVRFGDTKVPMPVKEFIRHVKAYSQLKPSERYHLFDMAIFTQPDGPYNGNVDLPQCLIFNSDPDKRYMQRIHKINIGDIKISRMKQFKDAVDSKNYQPAVRMPRDFNEDLYWAFWFYTSTQGEQFAEELKTRHESPVIQRMLRRMPYLSLDNFKYNVPCITQVPDKETKKLKNIDNPLLVFKFSYEKDSNKQKTEQIANKLIHYKGDISQKTGNWAWSMKPIEVISPTQCKKNNICEIFDKSGAHIGCNVKIWPSISASRCFSTRLEMVDDIWYCPGTVAETMEETMRKMNMQSDDIDDYAGDQYGDD